MSFKAIETQEDFDRAVGERIAREQETLAKKYSDYDQIKKRNAELETEVGTLQSTIEESNNAAKTHEQTVADLNAKIAGYEKSSLRTKIALQHGIPIDLADRLVGEDEESIKADAERFASFTKKNQTPPPLKNTESKLGDDKDGAYKALLKNTNFEGE